MHVYLIYAHATSYTLAIHQLTGLASKYVCSTSALMVRSPVLKEYFRDQPCWPNRRRPRTMEWNLCIDTCVCVMCGV